MKRVARVIQAAMGGKQNSPGSSRAANRTGKRHTGRPKHADRLGVFAADHVGVDALAAGVCQHLQEAGYPAVLVEAAVMIMVGTVRRISWRASTTRLKKSLRRGSMLIRPCNATGSNPGCLPPAGTKRRARRMMGARPVTILRSSRAGCTTAAVWRAAA
jgi:hypothetical protein